MARAPRPLTDRFWEKVARGGPNDCWLWRGAKRYGGYGVIGGGGQGGGKHLVATHVSLQLVGIAVPAGFWVLHRCDNPPCVNPAHLWLGNRKANMEDAAQKGRMATGTEHGRSKLTYQQVTTIRNSTQTHEVLAVRYGVTPSQIGNIQRGKHWKMDRTITYAAPGVNKGVKHPLATLTEDQVRAIRADPRKLKPVAEDYGLSIGQISNIRRRIRWAHVE